MGCFTERLDRLERKLDAVLLLARYLVKEDRRIMATLDQIAQDVADESTAIDSLTTFTAGLQQQLADALAGVTLPAGVQAKIDAVFAAVETNKAKLAAALAANVPVTPPAPPTPPTP